MDNLRPRSRLSDGLMARTLGLSRVYSDQELDRTERHLEREIRRESCIPPRDKKFARMRLRGEHVLHSKPVLLAVVILNLVDCALVLGELILDIHYIKELRDEREAFSQHFVDTMQAKYPDYLRGHNIDNLPLLYEELYKATCQWHNETDLNVAVIATNGFYGVRNETQNGIHKHYNVTNSETVQAFTPYTGHSPLKTRLDNILNGTVHGTDGYLGYTAQGIYESNDTTRKKRNRDDGDKNTAGEQGPSYTVDSGHGHSGELGGGHHGDGHHGNDHHGKHQHEHSIWEHVAHGMHKASITILGILFIENIAKAICMGKDFLMKKLEVFDAFVVVVSFIVDIVLLKGIMEYKIQDVIFILTFLLPWRVIRVVNSLIVAVLDHEHFRLKLLYQEKKKIAEELKVLKKQEKGWDFHLQKIEKFCESEGIPKWKIRQHTAMGRKQSTITTMASLALNGFLKGMMLMSPSDTDLLERSLTMSSQATTHTDNQTSLGTISEQDSVDNEDDVTNVTGSTKSRLHLTPRNSKRSEVPKIVVEPSDIATENDSDHHPIHGILKNMSRETFKNVSFEPKEQKPLLNKQDSVVSDDGIIYMDDNHAE